MVGGGCVWVGGGGRVGGGGVYALRIVSTDKIFAL